MTADNEEALPNGKYVPAEAIASAWADARGVGLESYDRVMREEMLRFGAFAIVRLRDVYGYTLAPVVGHEIGGNNGGIPSPEQPAPGRRIRLLNTPVDPG